MANNSDNWKHCLNVVARSDVGMRRANNQDSYAVVLAGDELNWFMRGHVFMVADGMGAHAAGELASKLAVDNIPHTYKKLTDLSPALAIQKSIVEANNLIYGRGQSNPEFEGMGTTCSTMLLLPQGVLLGHVGDSRIYRLRGDDFEQLTYDHSLVWEMITAGKIPEDDVPSFVPKNVITRSLGPHARVKVDLEGPLPIEIGDRYLLCSDGLTGPVADDELAVMLRCLSAEDAAQTMVDLANLRGGPDNITLIVVEVTAPQITQANFQLPEGEYQGGRVHPALWGMIGLCLVAAIAFMATGAGLVPAVLSLLAAVVAGGFGLAQWLEGGSSSSSHNITRRYGKGPYRSYGGHPSSEAVEKFGQTVSRLDTAAHKDGLNIDWDSFNALRDAAEAASLREDFAGAISEYSAAIRFMISQLRVLKSQQAKKST